MITSTSNPHIKAVRKLSESKERAATGIFLVEGLRVVGQAFDSKAQVIELIYSEELLISEYGLNLLEKAKFEDVVITEVSSAVFESLARKDNPQGIAAIVRQNWQNLSSLNTLASGILVVLESVQNPGNLGTILRTCDAVAAKGLILLDQSTDPYDPVAVKASMGAIFTVPVFRSDYLDLKTFLSRNSNLNAIGTSDKANKNVFDAIFPDPLLLLMGSEREGLSKPYAELCKFMVSIPMLGSCDSLNLSVATGVILYQILDQYNKKAYQ